MILGRFCFCGFGDASHDDHMLGKPSTATVPGLPPSTACLRETEIIDHPSNLSLPNLPPSDYASFLSGEEAGQRVSTSSNGQCFEFVSFCGASAQLPVNLTKCKAPLRASVNDLSSETVEQRPVAVVLGNLSSDQKLISRSYPDAASLPLNLAAQDSQGCTPKSRLSARSPEAQQPSSEITMRAISELVGAELRPADTTTASQTLSSTPDSSRQQPLTLHQQLQLQPLQHQTSNQHRPLGEHPLRQLRPPPAAGSAAAAAVPAAATSCEGDVGGGGRLRRVFTSTRNYLRLAVSSHQPFSRKPAWTTPSAAALKTPAPASAAGGRTSFDMPIAAAGSTTDDEISTVQQKQQQQQQQYGGITAGGAATAENGVAVAGALLPRPHASEPIMAFGPLYAAEGSSKLPYQTSRHLSQVAFLRMLHPAAAAGSPDSHTPPMALQYEPHLTTLNLAALSREITALKWIGQGGGGAVFQAVWQGAPVAVKFLLSEGERDEDVDAAALEGVVSSVVNHPNVVHTFAFQVTHLTAESFILQLADQDCQDSLMDIAGNRDLLESLLDTQTIGAYGTNHPASPASSTPRPVGVAAGAPAVGAGLSRLGTSPLAQSSPIGRPSNGGAQEAGGGPSAAEGGEGASATSEEEAAEEGEAGGGVAVMRGLGVEVGGGMRTSQAGGSISRTSRCEGLGPVVVNPRLAAVRQQDKSVAGAVPVPHSMMTPPQVSGLGQSQLDSTFHSEEGFGDPDPACTGKGWSVQQALAYLKARPGMNLTYIIMEYCDRGSLLTAIKRGVFRLVDSGAAAAVAPSASASAASRFPRRIVLRAVLRTARDVALGMSHLHANGIIHGDLKPGNVLLRGCRDRRGFVAMVADFGLSKVTQGDKPLELNHWSTVTVMAPEVIMGRWLKASDVFSFGILLWQLVTSEPVPYGRLTIAQILMGVSLGTLKPEWPAYAHPALVRLGRACLATSPEQRPSFQAVVKVLTKIEKHVRDELRVAREGNNK